MRLLVPLLLAALPALAEDRIGNVFRVWDLDGDGVLSADEIPDPGIFAKADADKDGKLTRAEVAAFLGVRDEPAPPAPEKKAEGKEKEAKSEAVPVKEPRTVAERVEDFFRRFDANKDRKIHRTEFQAGEEVFAGYDRNGDEALSVREVTRYVKDIVRAAKRAPQPENFLDLFDLDRDDRVTRSEYDGPADFFRRYDHDKDRTVTREELDMGADAGRMMPGDRELQADGPTAVPKQGLLERHDANGDGRVTLEELGGAEGVMRRLDRNRDGVLSGPEVR